MKTICKLNGRIIMSQSGEAVEAMNANAAQYAGATVEVVGDEQFAAMMAAQESVVPQVVTMRQARIALLNAGLLDQVNAAITGIPGPEGEAARIEWEFSSTVERDRPLVRSLTAALGWSEAQIDALFIQAAAL